MGKRPGCWLWILALLLTGHVTWDKSIQGYAHLSLLHALSCNMRTMLILLMGWFVCSCRCLVYREDSPVFWFGPVQFCAALQWGWDTMSLVSWECSINKFFSNCYVIDYYYHKYASINYFQNDIKESSVQFSLSVVSDSLWPREPQHTRPPCPSPAPGVHSNPCPLSWWCHPTI